MNFPPTSIVSSITDYRWGTGMAAAPIFQYRSESGPFQQLAELVANFGGLEYGWDGYSARPIPNAVIGNTVSTLAELASMGQKATTPTVSPEVPGTISMAWKSDLGDAYLELGETRYSGYVETKAGKGYYFEGDAKAIKPQALLTIYERLFSAAQATSVLHYQTDTGPLTHEIWPVPFRYTIPG